MITVFMDGLSRPTVFTVSLAWLVTALLTIAGTQIITEPWMARYGDRFSSGDEDVYATITRQALTAKTDPPSGGHLVLVGHVAPRYFDGRKHVDGHCDVTDLRTPYQSLSESLCLLDQVTSRSPAQVVLVISTRVFFDGQEVCQELETQSKLGVQSSWMAVESALRGVRPAPRRGNYFIDNQVYLLKRIPYLFSHLIPLATKLRWSGDPEAAWLHARCQLPAASFDPVLVNQNVDAVGRLLDRVHGRGLPACVVVTLADLARLEDWQSRRLEREVAGHKGELIRLADDEASFGELPEPYWSDLMGRMTNQLD